MNELPNVGDVITSPAFAYGSYRYDDKDRSGPVTIDSYRQKEHLIEQSVDIEERLQEAAKTGVIPPEEVVEDFSAYDESRGEAHFVVEKAMRAGGGPTGYPNDYWPDGWSVTARRLKPDGTYDPEGEVIKFYATGGRSDSVDLIEITILRKMKMKFE